MRKQSTAKIDSLLEPNKWTNTLDAIRSQVKNPIEKTGLNKAINKQIVKPLNGFIQTKWEKAGNRHTATTWAAINLLNAVEDVVYELEDGNGVIAPEYVFNAISIMDDKYHEWRAVNQIPQP